MIVCVCVCLYFVYNVYDRSSQMSSGELRKGKWLKSEEKVLTQNAQEFLRENGLTEYRY